MDPARLRAFFNPRYPCVRIVTTDEGDAVQLALDAADGYGFETWTWSSVRGLRRSTFADAPSEEGTENPAAALCHALLRFQGPSLLVLLDLAEHLSDPRVLRAWRELAARGREGHASRVQMVMIDHAERVPEVVAAESVLYRIQLPGDEEIRGIIRRVVSRLHRVEPVDAKVPTDLLDELVQNLRGLSRRQVEDAATEMVSNDRRLTREDLDVIHEHKRRAFEAAGVLEHVKAPTSLDRVGGLARLKEWLRVRRESFTARAGEFGLLPPRGVLLLGVQGAGKSLAAKAIATAWGRPLLRLDAGALYDRYIGESERRLRDALRQSEAMAPMVLWIDEIEKAFAGAASTSSDGGLSRRMFGSLLTWMQEHRAPVFLVATANDIEALPPELLRKGRFDEIFFVDLPAHDVRKVIFEIHLSRRGQDPAGFNLDALATASEGFSGAEIEQAVLAALHGAFADRVGLSTQRVLDAIGATVPLSRTMGERIAALRRWAHGRCVPAD
jgi:SpoVK/Ycf46/Vps4 family AAA+-type ATPase